MCAKKDAARAVTEAKDEALSGISFEDGLKKLEAILETLESEGIPLEESIAKYEEGTRLYNLCREKLETLERKIEVLTKNAVTGEIEAKPYSRPETE